MNVFSIRAALPSEGALIVAHRRAMFAEMGRASPEVLDAMSAAFAPWVAERMARGEYLGWFAVDGGGRVAGGAGVWVMDWPPHSLDPQPRRANVLNVYVEPEFRRQGLARRLMDHVLAGCRAKGLGVVILHASESGRPLYAALGFQATNEMRLILAR